jgi:hypothetical protein
MPACEAARPGMAGQAALAGNLLRTCLIRLRAMAPRIRTGHAIVANGSCEPLSQNQPS